MRSPDQTQLRHYLHRAGDRTLGDNGVMLTAIIRQCDSNLKTRIRSPIGKATAWCECQSLRWWVISASIQIMNIRTMREVEQALNKYQALKRARAGWNTAGIWMRAVWRAFKNPRFEVTKTDFVATAVATMVNVFVSFFLPSWYCASSTVLHETSGMTSHLIWLKKQSRRRHSPAPPTVPTIELNTRHAVEHTVTRSALSISCMMRERVLRVMSDSHWEVHVRTYMQIKCTRRSEQKKATITTTDSTWSRFQL